MTSTRAAAVKIVVVYWALLIAGMLVYTALRADVASHLAPVWVGTIVGTALGQVLAVRRFQAVPTFVATLAIAVLLVPYVSHEHVWLAYLPATLCGYWSLGDRTSLAAFWFPAMIWMLSILDGTDASSLPDRGHLAMLGALAAMFVIFLRVREERRIALWRTVSPTAVAVAAAPIVLRERAGSRAARGAWALLVTTLGFAATARIAPLLWSPEAFGAGHVTVTSVHGHRGLPCCPAFADEDVSRARVKEYFDLGRGHDRGDAIREPRAGCRVCAGGGAVEGSVTADVRVVGELYPADPGDSIAGTEASGGFVAIAAAGDPATAPITAPATPEPREAPAPVGAGTPTAAPVVIIMPRPPAEPEVAIATPVATPPPAPATLPVPQQVAPAAAAPSPALTRSDDPPPATAAAGDAPPPARVPDGPGVDVLRWGVLVVVALMFISLVSLVLRPLRRLVILRHLRAPYWDETVDQRVSNSWQLALVGLRDAGWRTASAEAPHELARRVGISDVERCASILDRARHGVAIDRDDLANIREAADASYAAARAGMSRLGRAASWLRWPLV